MILSIYIKQYIKKITLEMENLLLLCFLLLSLNASSDPIVDSLVAFPAPTTPHFHWQKKCSLGKRTQLEVQTELVCWISYAGLGLGIWHNSRVIEGDSCWSQTQKTKKPRSHVHRPEEVKNESYDPCCYCYLYH